MLPLFAVAGIIVGYLTKGSLKNITSHDLRWYWLPIAALAMEAAGRWLCPAFISREPWFGILTGASYGLVLAFIIINIRVIWFAIPAFLGTLSNFAVIAANDFYMPVAKTIAAQIPFSRYVIYRFIDEDTIWPWLGDIISWPWPHGLASIGDLFIGLAAIGLIVHLMHKNNVKK